MWTKIWTSRVVENEEIKYIIFKKIIGYFLIFQNLFAYGFFFQKYRYLVHINSYFLTF